MGGGRRHQTVQREFLEWQTVPSSPPCCHCSSLSLHRFSPGSASIRMAKIRMAQTAYTHRLPIQPVSSAHVPWYLLPGSPFYLPICQAFPWACQGFNCHSLGSIQAPSAAHPFPLTLRNKIILSKLKFQRF